MLYFLYISIFSCAVFLIWALSMVRVPIQIRRKLKEILFHQPLECVLGSTGYVHNGRVRIAYELHKSKVPNGETFVVINGHGQSRLMFPPNLLKGLLRMGYHVITHDNRGVGESDWLLDWNLKSPYSLEDMAGDTLSVLKELNVKKAHFLGVSMGGMIAQNIAIHHASKVLSLSLFMTSAFYNDPSLIQLTKAFYSKVMGVSILYGMRLNTPYQKILFQIALHRLLQGNSLLEVDHYLNVYQYEIVKRNGFNKLAAKQHTAAINISGSRYDLLKKLKIPVLIIHGKEDPLILISHAHKMEQIIPKTNAFYVNGMGHDIPEKYIPDILKVTSDYLLSIKNELATTKY